ncbi:MAG: CRISPR-associated helicase Cas3' [Pseudomonadota bacterium]
MRLARGSPSQTGSVAAQCAEWISDDRRKAFFAEVGAGTIDQALLSVLPKKFLALRQFGLAGRVLIVDEAHAFDAYMSSELARLLQFHAAAGGSAIVLSATLPRAKRRELVAAFQSGLDIDTTVDLSAENYPLLTVVGKTGVQEDGIEDRADGARAVAVERLGDEPAAIERALSAAASGAAVLWVRNAVDDARDAYDQLSERWERVELFHARFAMCDRQRIETSVVERYGKSGDEEARHGRILVATQVVEQSLDLDFDLVISDLAPVDLIIQRVGRLWRHMDLRPASTRPIQGPRLLLLSPDPDDVRCPAWQHEIQAKGGYVYPNAGVLWRSAKTLFDAQEIRAPEGLRSLIEFAYGTQEIPEPLRDAEKRAQGDDYAAAFLADTNLVSLDDGYAGMREIHSDQEIGTRLGRPTATLRLARNVDGKLQPWAETDSLTRSWALSEVSVDARWLGDLETPLELTALVDEVRSNWAEWDRSVVAVVNDTEISLETASGDRPLRYELTQGLWRLSVDRKH